MKEQPRENALSVLDDAQAAIPVIRTCLAPLLTWYRSRPDARTFPWRMEEPPVPYHIWISEIMLQQTRAAAALPYYERFIEALPTIRALAEADEDTLLKLWQGLGYYTRARNLKKAARVVMEAHGGRLPASREELLALPGIGRYTSSAIGSIAFGLPLPAVDGNILRVVSRLLCSREDVLKDSTRQKIEAILVPCYPEGKDAGALNQAFMDLGSALCLPRAPHCPRCPLERLCLAHAECVEKELPIRKKAKERRIEKLTVLRIERGNAIALVKRPEKGLLAGLWGLPQLAGWPKKSEVAAWLSDQDLCNATITRLPAATHVFSHVEWHMKSWRVTLPTDAHTIRETAGFTWATEKELAKSYSIPSAFQYFLSSSCP